VPLGISLELIECVFDALLFVLGATKFLLYLFNTAQALILFDCSSTTSEGNHATTTRRNAEEAYIAVGRDPPPAGCTYGPSPS